MFTKDSIEQAHAFLHQKWRVYEYSNSETQRDEIEYAISSYVDMMNRSLYDELAQGRPDFLLSHRHFAEEMKEAVERLERLMTSEG